MTLKSHSAAAEQASLVRKADSAPKFPGLDRIGAQLAGELRDSVASLGCPDTFFTRSNVELSDFGSWQAAEKPTNAAIRIQIKPIKGTVLLSVPTLFVMQLVDLFYGGSGQAVIEERDLSGAELRFLERFGEQCLGALAQSWAAIQPVSASLAGVDPSLASTSFCKGKDLVAVQSFTVRNGPLKGCSISCVYQVSALRTITALADADSFDEEVNVIDPIWRSRMTDAVLQVRLPLRSVFARPELPLSQLLTLQPGEVIPICLPTSVPITIAGRQFAMASIGESNGRVAVRIEKLQSGGPVYE
jgi:flagellar motor switch protein FliM